MNTSKCTEKNVSFSGRIRTITKKAGTNEVLRISEWTENLIMDGTNTGINIIMDKLNSDNTYTLNITHADIGTGTATPTHADTQLQTAVARTSKANGYVTGDVLSLFFFWPDASLTNGTYTEFGAFIDGASGINTGQIFEHALFQLPYAKSAGEDTTVQLDITGSTA